MTYMLCDGIKFMKSLSNESVDGIFTDPPWGNRISKSSTGHRRPDIKIMGQSNWLELLKSMTDEAARIFKKDGRCLIWLGIRHIGPAIRVIESLEYRWMVFVRYIPPHYLAGFTAEYDAILYFARPESAWPKKIGPKLKPQEYIRPNTNKKDSYHPCPRPLKSVKQILNDWFEVGEYIIDPFSGSDTTGKAARELDLKWDSCEIDPKMFQTGIDRHSQGFLFEKK